MIRLDAQLLQRQIYGRTTNRTTNITRHRVRNYFSVLICFSVLETVLLIAHIIYDRVTEQLVNNELKMTWKDAVVVCFKILHLNKIYMFVMIVY
jgi:hypothetical protein